MTDKIILRDAFLVAPPEALSPALRPLIEKWDDEVTPLQLLELLDAVYAGEGTMSDSLLSVLKICYGLALVDNKTAHDEVVKGASWRQAA